ncbi:putative chromosome-partitioning protein ParB [Corynebacterium faecale]|uniref:ParB/RepB/Spo0J family partition protein n=1 Tax=Corynebacterium faecale TaxID=1758466 RepID=UPI0025B5AFCF|nr:ParB/RepB/Spo0J family partition protein [Corynebacterium faecale]WJY93503.1 putative chromosome-partitioning protein ParB [Corynebacterium faecale]
MAQNKSSDKSHAEKRKGGLGRGLAALIPSGPTDSPGLGGGAADIILGGAVGERARRRPEAAPRIGMPSIPKPDTPARPEGPVATPQPTSPPPSAEIPQPTVPVEQEPVDGTSTSDFGASYQEIPIDSIVPNPQQPRAVFDTEALDELVHSIREFGLMQPIVVRRAGEGFELIMGERRWRASRRAGLEFIPAIVRETDDSAMLRDALLENIHRVQLNPLEEAAAYQQLLEEFGVTQTELADKLGRSRPVITNMIRLLNLPVNVQTKVAAGVLSAGHARAILGLKAGEEAQDALATRIIAEGLSVRATEEVVLLQNRGDEDAKKPPREKAPTPEVFTRAAESLADNLDTKVSVMMGKRKGRLVVEFGDKDDFERIMGLIQGPS